MTTNRMLDMTKGKPAHLLLGFTMPLFLGNLLQQFYNLVDTCIAGNILGDRALSQIGVTTALYGLITNAAFGLNNGLALTVSRHMFFMVHFGLYLYGDMLQYVFVSL